MPETLPEPTLCNRIPYIVTLRSNEQVPGIEARRFIAAMKDLKITIYVKAEVKMGGQSMYTHLPSLPPNQAVLSTWSLASPIPTAGVGIVTIIGPKGDPALADDFWHWSWRHDLESIPNLT